MITLEELIETYLLRTGGLDSLRRLEDARKKREILREMMRQYPQHADELMHFAAQDSMRQVNEAIEKNEKDGA